MSMKRIHKLSTVPMANLVSLTPTIGSIEVCPVKVQRLSCFKVHYHVLGLFSKASLKIIPERLSVMVILLYDKIEGVTFANCWAHVRRYWMKANSKNGQIGVSYCDALYRLERKFKHLSPSKRRKKRQKFALPIVKKFLDWVEKSPFYGKNALAKAAEYTLNRANGLKAFLKDYRIEIDNNPAENAIRPNVMGRKTGSFPSVKLVQKPTPSV